ncbi:hypothetical protein TRVA0_050S00738 [Trichomonascus vanleenenianus]|uniref:uncharacterized protein n=1 Tax=Trichomonascus vanleenenianus TaxID=2268995 RepID=UPI003ECA3E64
MIGPPVPDHIQRARDERLGRRKEPKVHESEDESSDDDFGPTLPPTTADAEEMEREALERLERRSRADASQESRSDWLSVALGGKPPVSNVDKPKPAKVPVPDFNEGRPSLMEEHMANKKNKKTKGDAFDFRKTHSEQAAKFIQHAKSYKSKFTQ